MIHVLLILMVIGFLVYLVETYIPMSPPIKIVIRVIVVVFLCLWLMQVLGISDLPVPRVR